MSRNCTWQCTLRDETSFAIPIHNYLWRAHTQSQWDAPGIAKVPQRTFAKMHALRCDMVVEQHSCACSQFAPNTRHIQSCRTHQTRSMLQGCMSRAASSKKSSCACSQSAQIIGVLFATRHIQSCRTPHTRSMLPGCMSRAASSNKASCACSQFAQNTGTCEHAQLPLLLDANTRHIAWQH